MRPTPIDNLLGNINDYLEQTIDAPLGHQARLSRDELVAAMAVYEYSETTPPAGETAPDTVNVEISTGTLDALAELLQLTRDFIRSGVGLPDVKHVLGRLEHVEWNHLRSGKGATLL